MSFPTLLNTSDRLTDCIYFGNRLASGGAVPSTRRVDTANGLQGGGELSSNLTLQFGPLTQDTNLGQFSLYTYNDLRIANAQDGFAADPSGTFDSSPNITAALATGLPVYVPAGTYRIDTPITCPQHSHLFGDGRNTIFQANGDNYIFDINTGEHSRYHDFCIQAASPQAAGGGFDFTNVRGGSIVIDHLFVFSNLFRVFNIASDHSSGVYLFDAIRFIGDNTGIVFNFEPGAGILITDTYVNRFVGTALSANGVGTWFAMSTAAGASALDSPQLCDVAFFQGTNGLTTTGGNRITGCKLMNFVADTCAVGFQLDNVQDWTITGGAINTCGDATTPGVQIQSNANAVALNGLTVQNCPFTGILIDGANNTSVVGCKVMSNNTTNDSNGDGIRVAADTDNFEIVGNTVINQTGSQKIGIHVVDGTSDFYDIVANNLEGNATPLHDGGSGADKLVASRVRELKAGNLTLLQNASAAAGGTLSFGNKVENSATAGAHGALPAQVAGYVVFYNGSIKQKIPFYAD